MLDVSVRTGILKLFKRLQRERDLSILYNSHVLSTINYLADRTMFMCLGDVVEIGPTGQVIHERAHPYTEALLDSVPDPIDLPTGCRFHPRCQYATQECRAAEPPLEPPTPTIPGSCERWPAVTR